MLIRADARSIPLRDGCVQCVITSPPYFGLRDYGTAQWVRGEADCEHRVPATGGTMNKGNNNREGTPFRSVCGVCGAERVDSQIGLEPSPSAYVDALVSVFRDVRRVLSDDGVVWCNLGDSYAGSGPSGASYQSETTKRRAVMTHDGPFALSKTLEARGLSYAEKKPIPPSGWKSKDLLGIPWRVAFALQADGWYLRSDVIWHKPNPMPESVTDRPTKAHEYLFLLTKSERYYYDQDAIREPYVREWDETKPNGSTGRDDWGEGVVLGRASNPHGGIAKMKPYRGQATKDYDSANAQNPSDTKRRVMESMERLGGANKRSVWTVNTQPYTGAHFATMPEKLVEPCVLAGSRFGDLVFDPFSGSGTVLAVAERLGRRAVGTDLNPAYHELAKVRTSQRGLKF